MRQMNEAVVAVVAAPWGPVHLAATDRGVVAIESLSDAEGFTRRLRARLAAAISGGPPAARHLADEAADQLAAYFAGRRRMFDLPIDLAGRPAWDVSVLEGVRAVPWGAVTSYGRVARRVGRPGAARAVGGAVRRNPIAIVVPCHRVDAGNGSLGGYGGEWFGAR